MKLKIIFIILFFSSCGFSFAETVINAEVDKSAITSDEALSYKVTINSSGEKISTPNFPAFEGFRVVSQIQSSNIAFIDGGMKTTMVYNFILVPLRTGKITIGPVQLQAEGKLISTQPYEIEVTGGNGKIRPQPKKIPLFPDDLTPETNPDESDQPKITL